MRTPAAPETSGRASVPHLFPLAAASLSMAFGAACLGAVAQLPPAADAVRNSVGETAADILQVGSGVLGLSAALAGAAPAMLAEGHRLFRCMLVGAHFLVGWSTQAVGYLGLFRLGADFMAVLCVSSFLSLLGVFAGLAVGMLVFAALWGWLLTRRAGNANRPTFSLRGILTATALAALLFASPRIIEPVATAAVHRIYHYFDLQPEQPTTMISNDMSLNSVSLVSLVIGLVLASMFASAVCIRRSRWGWLGLGIGAFVVGTLVFVGSVSGGPAPPPGLAIGVAVVLFIGSLQATLQTHIWEAFGWRLVRIRRSLSGSSPPMFDALPAREEGPLQ